MKRIAEPDDENGPRKSPSYPMGLIGGVFGLGLDDCGTQPPFLGDDSVLMANARSAVLLLIETLRPRTVWMPSYLCQSLVQGVPSGPRLRFYEVDDRLRVHIVDRLRYIGRGDVVFFIDYFGFPTPEDIVRKTKLRGAIVVRDACQALLSRTSPSGFDFEIFSPRKFLGIPDGGILAMVSSGNWRHRIRRAKLTQPPLEWWMKAFRSVYRRHEFDLNAGNREWFRLYQESESTIPVGYFRMSPLSHGLLGTAFDYPAIASRRRANYLDLLSHLGELALCPELRDGVVPLGFPIGVGNRDVVQEGLFKRAIYPPIHWPVPEVVPRKYELSRQLSRRILTLPCDQRYDRRDMRRIARAVLDRAEP